MSISIPERFRLPLTPPDARKFDEDLIFSLYNHFRDDNARLRAIEMSLGIVPGHITAIDSQAMFNFMHMGA